MPATPFDPVRYENELQLLLSFVVTLNNHRRQSVNFYDVEIELTNLNGTKRVIVMIPEAVYVHGNDRRVATVTSALQAFCMRNTGLSVAQVDALILNGLQPGEIALAAASRPLVCVISLCREANGLTADVVAMFEPQPLKESALPMLN